MIYYYIIALSPWVFKLYLHMDVLHNTHIIDNISKICNMCDIFAILL